MVIRVTAATVSDIASKRLRKQTALRDAVLAIIDLPRRKELREVLLRAEAGRTIPLLLELLNEAQGNTKIVEGQIVALAAQLSEYDAFTILIYVSAISSYFSALHKVLGDLLHGPKDDETAGDRASQSVAKELEKHLTKSITDLSQAEALYLIGQEPKDVGKLMFAALNTWVSILLRHEGIKENKIITTLREVASEAGNRFLVWLSSNAESAQWLRTYLAYQPQRALDGKLADSMDSLRAALEGWISAPKNYTSRSREADWQAYRATLLSLPDEKGTMFAEEFGVREVFIHPLASYNIAGTQGKSQPKINDVANLVGALLSTRIAGDELILMCGGPGSGKSTLCRNIASELAKDKAVHPIFLRLRRLREGADVPVFVEDHLRANGLISKLSDVRELANPVLILDGFDELVLASRPRLFNFFNKLREDLSSGPLRGIKAIVSGRDTLFPGGAGLPTGSHVINLLPFDKLRVEAWGEKWRSLHVGQLGSEFRPEAFLDNDDIGGRKHSSPLHHLVSWPLTLHLVARIQNAGGLPVQSVSSKDVEKAILYRGIMAETARRQQEQTAGQEGRLDDAQTRDFLRAIAWQMYESSRDSLDYHEVEPILSQYMKRRSESDPSELAHVAVVNAPELTRGEERGFEFVHKSFAEFLVAEVCAEALEDVAFKTAGWKGQEPTWRMTHVESVGAIANKFACRLFPQEVEEMLAPMLDDYGNFEAGVGVQESSALGRQQQSLCRKLDRLREIVERIHSAETFYDVDRTTKKSALAQTPSEALANFVVAILILITSVCDRLTRMQGHGQPKVRALVRPSDLMRIIHSIEAGGISVDHTLAYRMFSGLSLAGEDEGPVQLLYPPIAPGLLGSVSAASFPMASAVAELTERLREAETKSLLHSLITSTLFDRIGFKVKRKVKYGPSIKDLEIVTWGSFTLREDTSEEVLERVGLLPRRERTPILLAGGHWRSSWGDVWNFGVSNVDRKGGIDRLRSYLKHLRKRESKSRRAEDDIVLLVQLIEFLERESQTSGDAPENLVEASGAKQTGDE